MLDDLVRKKRSILRPTTTARNMNRWYCPGQNTEPAGQWFVRDRRGHGDQHPAAQSGRGRERRRPRSSTDPETDIEELMKHRPGAGFPDRGDHQRHRGYQGRLIAPAGARGVRAGARPRSDRQRRAAARPSSSPSCRTRSTRPIVDRKDRRGWSTRREKSEGISELRDESDKSGMRMVIELQSAAKCRTSS